MRHSSMHNRFECQRIFYCDLWFMETELKSAFHCVIFIKKALDLLNGDLRKLWEIIWGINQRLRISVAVKYDTPCHRISTLVSYCSYFLCLCVFWREIFCVSFSSRVILRHGTILVELPVFFRVLTSDYLPRVSLQSRLTDDMPRVSIQLRLSVEKRIIAPMSCNS